MMPMSLQVSGERTMTTKTHQKDIIKENAPYKSTKFYNDQQNPQKVQSWYVCCFNPFI